MVEFGIDATEVDSSGRTRGEGGTGRTEVTRVSTVGLGEAFTTENVPLAVGSEGDLAGCATLGTNSVVHFWSIKTPLSTTVTVIAAWSGKCHMGVF